MSRISRDEMFMRIAETVAMRGTCNRAQVGAVLVIDGRIVSIGYNGSLPGQPHCDDIGHKIVNGHCIRTIHAEVNCLQFALKLLNSPSGNEATMYVTHLPCESCAKYIAEHNDHTNFRITRLVYGKKYPENVPDVILCQRYITLMEGGVSSIEQYQL